MLHSMPKIVLGKLANVLQENLGCVPKKELLAPWPLMSLVAPASESLLPVI